MLRARSPIPHVGPLAVFPLSGVVLMPYGHLPLNIFEPRYINMIDDALGGSRLIGMVQPRMASSELVADDAPLFDIGSIGRIVSFQDPGDGRYQIILEGQTRFRIQTELPLDASRGYRQVIADTVPFSHDRELSQEDDGPGRARILELLQHYFNDKGIETDWSSVSEAPYEALVSSLAMNCPFEPSEKQALLECDNHAVLAQMLISLFEMNAEGNTAPSGGIKH